MELENRLGELDGWHHTAWVGVSRLVGPGSEEMPLQRRRLLKLGPGRTGKRKKKRIWSFAEDGDSSLVRLLCAFTSLYVLRCVVPAWKHGRSRDRDDASGGPRHVLSPPNAQSVVQMEAVCLATAGGRILFPLGLL